MRGYEKRVSKLIEKVRFEKRPAGSKGRYKYKLLFLLFVLSLSTMLRFLVLNTPLKSLLSLNLDIFRKVSFCFFKPLAQVLVLAPTRELANQVAKDFKDITRKLSVACFYGGTSYQSQSE